MPYIYNNSALYSGNQHHVVNPLYFNYNELRGKNTQQQLGDSKRVSDKCVQGDPLCGPTKLPGPGSHGPTPGPAQPRPCGPPSTLTQL